jgi:DNA-binding cell septation regulator SpoVG
MQVMDVRIRPANEDFVKSCASICFEECFLVHDIGIIKGPTGVFIRLPSYPAIHFETRNMIEQAVLAEYEKVVGGSDPERSDNQ